MSRVIAKLLQPTCVLLNQKFDNSEDIIRAISMELYKAGFVKESFAQAAIDREKNLPHWATISRRFQRSHTTYGN